MLFLLMGTNDLETSFCYLEAWANYQAIFPSIDDAGFSFLIQIAFSKLNAVRD